MNPRLAYCHIIASMLAADGRVTDGERAFLNETMNKAELTEAEREQVRHFEGAGGAEDAVRQLPEEERRVLLDEVVGAALADGKLSPLEMRMVKHLTSVLGFSD